jgi:tape measure domain-containing protein
MAESVARILIKADGADSAAAALKKLDGSMASLGRSAESVVNTLRGFGLVLGVEGARRALAAADSYKTLEARIKGITAETGDYVKVSDELREVSRSTGSQLETTVSVFQSLTRSSKELGATNTQMITLTRLVQQLGVIGGASTSAMQAGLLQFSQAMAAGTIRAEEFNSILENLPELANAIARGLGVSTGELRKMVISGRLLSKDVFQVLLEQSGEIEERFKQMPVTAERGWNAFEQSLVRILSKLDKVSGVTDFIGRGLQGWANYLDPTPLDQFNRLLRERQQLEAVPAKTTEQYNRLIDIRRELKDLQAANIAATEKEAQQSEQGTKLTIAQKLAAQDAEAAVKSLNGAYDKLIASLRAGQAAAAAGPKKELEKSTVLDINTLRDKARTALEKGDTKAAENFIKQAQAVNDYLLETSQVTKQYYQTQADLLLGLAEAGRAILNKEKPEIALGIDEAASAQAQAEYLELSRQFWAQNPAYQPVYPVFAASGSAQIGAGTDLAPVTFDADGLPQYAAGGLLRGPGTGTSDSMLARVSNGEYVVNAAATRQFLPLLQSINRMRLPRFATGGPVATSPTASYRFDLNGRSISGSGPADQVTAFASELRREVLRRGRR